MNIVNEYAVMIFKKEYEGKVFYSLGLSRKDRDGQYINGYMSCRFKNGIELENQTKIYIKKAWLDFYLKDKATIPYIFISEFETLQDAMQPTKEVVEEIPQNFKTLYEEKEIVIEDNDLPF